MSKNKRSVANIINTLREVEVLIGQGMTVKQASRKAGISDNSYYKWRKEYGGMEINQAKRLRELERENLRLKKLVADLSLDNAILKEVSKGNF